jgi:bacterioferritin
MHALESMNRHEECAMTDSPLEAELTTKVIASLNNILELELAGVVRYMHYSFMIFGHNRIPIVAWLRDQGNESNAHAVMAGEHITAFGGHPSLKIGSLLETHQHDVNEILIEAHEHEKQGLEAYYTPVPETAPRPGPAGDSTHPGSVRDDDGRTGRSCAT